MWSDTFLNNAYYSVTITRLDSSGFKQEDVLEFRVSIHRDDDFVDVRVLEEADDVAPEDMVLVIRAIEDASYMALVRKRVLEQIAKQEGRPYKKQKRGRKATKVTTPQPVEKDDDLPF